jgi:hypothetical protein
MAGTVSARAAHNLPLQVRSLPMMMLMSRCTRRGQELWDCHPRQRLLPPPGRTSSLHHHPPQAPLERQQNSMGGPVPVKGSGARGIPPCTVGTRLTEDERHRCGAKSPTKYVRCPHPAGAGTDGITRTLALAASDLCLPPVRPATVKDKGGGGNAINYSLSSFIVL